MFLVSVNILLPGKRIDDVYPRRMERQLGRASLLRSGFIPIAIKGDLLSARAVSVDVCQVFPEEATPTSGIFVRCLHSFFPLGFQLLF